MSKALPLVVEQVKSDPTTDDELRALIPAPVKGKILIIDPVSPEFNRGSFCYMGYLVFAAMKDLGYDVEILEDFSAAGTEELPEVDMYFVVLWSHTQIEHVHTIHRFLPKGKVQCFGFFEMIRGQYLPCWEVDTKVIQRGMVRYHRHFPYFKQILLSDCDMHLKGCEGQVYPFFTSYGCPRGCTFCPTTLNLPPDSPSGGRIETPLEELFPVMQEMIDMGMVNWHFTDEDFYLHHERAAAICEWLANHKQEFQIITLGERHTVSVFIKHHGIEILQRAGIKLIEIGLESAEEDLGKDMGKGGLKACAFLNEQLAGKIHIMWLCMAFYPGETISALNATGAFMKEHGLRLDQLYDRITTNGTYGGLGQFWQYYEGYKGEGGVLEQPRDSIDSVKLDGFRITTRPMRLMPSFVPRSFMEDKVKAVSRSYIAHSDYQWFDNYRVDVPNFVDIQNDIDNLKNGVTVQQIVEEQYPNNPVDGYLALAVAAKIGIIK